MSGGPGEVKQKTLQTTKNGLQRYFLASLGRFELPAFRLGGERSILLSYRDVYQNYSIIPLKRIRASCRLGGDRSIQLSYGGLYNKYSNLQGSRIRTIRFLGGVCYIHLTTEASKEILKTRGRVLYQLMFRDIYEMFRF